MNDSDDADISLSKLSQLEYSLIDAKNGKAVNIVKLFLSHNVYLHCTD